MKKHFNGMHMRHLIAVTCAATGTWLCCAAECGVGERTPEGYCPPMISNGDLNMLVDWWGGQGTNEYFLLPTEVYWQGRRGVA